MCIPSLEQVCRWDDDCPLATEPRVALHGRGRLLGAGLAGRPVVCVRAGLGGAGVHNALAGYVVFESFSKVAWSLALAWVIFACAEVGDLHHRVSTPRAAQGAELVYKSVLYDPIAFSCVYCIQ